MELLMSVYPDTGPGVYARGPALLPVEPSNIPRELVQLKAWYPAIIRPKANGKPGLDKIPGDPATGRAALWKANPVRALATNTCRIAGTMTRSAGRRDFLG
jgi:hypothetical protein